MPGKIEQRLAEIGVALPSAPLPAANYLPFVNVKGLLHVAGQLPLLDGKLATGKLGADAEISAGAAAAKICAINLLAQVRAACNGDLDRLEQVVKVTGFVNSTPDFGEHPAVINGTSNFLVEILGAAGRHARSAVGVASLPFGAMVEVEGVFRIR